MTSNERIIEEASIVSIWFLGTDMFWQVFWAGWKATVAIRFRLVTMGRYSYVEIPALRMKFLDTTENSLQRKEVATSGLAKMLGGGTMIEHVDRARPDELRELVVRPKFYLGEDKWIDIR